MITKKFAKDSIIYDTIFISILNTLFVLFTLYILRLLSVDISIIVVPVYFIISITNVFLYFYVYPHFNNSSTIMNKVFNIRLVDTTSKSAPTFFKRIANYKIIIIPLIICFMNFMFVYLLVNSLLYPLHTSTALDLGSLTLIIFPMLLLMIGLLVLLYKFEGSFRNSNLSFELISDDSSSGYVFNKRILALSTDIIFIILVTIPSLILALTIDKLVIQLLFGAEFNVVIVFIITVIFDIIAIIISTLSIPRDEEIFTIGYKMNNIILKDFEGSLKNFFLKSESLMIPLYTVLSYAIITTLCRNLIMSYDMIYVIFYGLILINTILILKKIISNNKLYKPYKEDKYKKYLKLTPADPLTSKQTSAGINDFFIFIIIYLVTVMFVLGQVVTHLDDYYEYYILVYALFTVIAVVMYYVYYAFIPFMFGGSTVGMGIKRISLKESNGSDIGQIQKLLISRKSFYLGFIITSLLNLVLIYQMSMYAEIDYGIAPSGYMLSLYNVMPLMLYVGTIFIIYARAISETFTEYTKTKLKYTPPKK